MADSRTERRNSDGPIGALIQYFREVRGEMRKVTWPTRPEAIRLTGMVLAVTAALTTFLYTFDYIFSTALEMLVSFYLGV